MADQPTRVLFRYLAGLPYRQAPEEERKEMGEAYAKLVEQWKSEGIRLLGHWSGMEQVDGFGHYAILEVNDLSKIREMSDDLGREVGKYLEKMSFHIGWSIPALEEPWKSS
jgi:hypothetical protein